MAKVASRRGKAMLVVAVLMPLWSSYLVKVLRLADDPLRGRGHQLGARTRSGSRARLRHTAVWLVMSYLWLPYMILPIYAGLERIPNSLISASEDLGATPFTTFRRVILPLAFPAVVAGSIFTFSLTLGDYITPQLVSNSQFIGNVDLLQHHQQPALRRGARDGPDRGHDRLPAGRPQARRLRAHLMRADAERCRATRDPAALARRPRLAFIYMPLIVIVIYAFNSSRSSNGRRRA